MILDYITSGTVDIIDTWTLCTVPHEVISYNCTVVLLCRGPFAGMWEVITWDTFTCSEINTTIISKSATPFCHIYINRHGYWHKGHFKIDTHLRFIDFQTESSSGSLSRPIQMFGIFLWAKDGITAFIFIMSKVAKSTWCVWQNSLACVQFFFPIKMCVSRLMFPFKPQAAMIMRQSASSKLLFPISVPVWTTSHTDQFSEIVFAVSQFMMWSVAAEQQSPCFYSNQLCDQCHLHTPQHPAYQ